MIRTENRTETLHASCVALDGKGLLILGPSGSGKSSLALQMMGLGAALVADDRTILSHSGDGALLASAPAPIRGRIEARGVGILGADAVGPVGLAAVVDLGQQETDRLPPLRNISLLGCRMALVLGPLQPHLASALCQLLRGGRID